MKNITIKRTLIALAFTLPIGVFMEAITDTAWNNNEDIALRVIQAFAGLSIVFWGYVIAKKIDK